MAATGSAMPAIVGGRGSGVHGIGGIVADGGYGHRRGQATQRIGRTGHGKTRLQHHQADKQHCYDAQMATQQDDECG